MNVCNIDGSLDVEELGIDMEITLVETFGILEYILVGGLECLTEQFLISRWVCSESIRRW